MSRSVGTNACASRWRTIHRFASKRSDAVTVGSHFAPRSMPQWAGLSRWGEALAAPATSAAAPGTRPQRPPARLRGVGHPPLQCRIGENGLDRSPAVSIVRPAPAAQRADDSAVPMHQ